MKPPTASACSPCSSRSISGRTLTRCAAAPTKTSYDRWADDVIDYAAQDFTEGAPIHDVIFDVLGKAGFPRSLRALKPGGRYLLVGFSGGFWTVARAARAWRVGTPPRTGARFITGAADPKQADLVFLQELIDAGKLRTVIGRRMHARRDRRSAPLRR